MPVSLPRSFPTVTVGAQDLALLDFASDSPPGSPSVDQLGDGLNLFAAYMVELQDALITLAAGTPLPREYLSDLRVKMLPRLVGVPVVGGGRSYPVTVHAHQLTLGDLGGDVCPGTPVGDHPGDRAYLWRADVVELQNDRVALSAV